MTTWVVIIVRDGQKLDSISKDLTEVLESSIEICQVDTESKLKRKCNSLLFIEHYG